MRIAVLDIETTSIDIEEGQIIEIGVVLMDTSEKPSDWRIFHRIIKYPIYSGQAEALAMNFRIFDIISQHNKRIATDIQVVRPESLIGELNDFISGHKNFFVEYNMNDIDEKINVGGKNVGMFDLPFLKKHHQKYSPSFVKYPNFHRRTIDPTIMYADLVNDEEMPNLEECKKRAGLPPLVTHNAVEDAWDVAKLLMIKLMGYTAESINELKFN